MAISPRFPPKEIDLIDDIPIMNGRLMTGDLDTKFGLAVHGKAGESDEHMLGRLGGTVAEYGRPEISLREVIQAVGSADPHRIWRYFRQIARRIHTYPATYMLTDAILAYIDGDTLDALLFEDHAFNIIRYVPNLHILLRVVFQDESLASDRDVDVKEMLATLYMGAAPPSLLAHTDRYGEAYSRRVHKMLRLISEVHNSPGEKP
ncbi:MAG TPA: hypothetical protein VJ256_04105 [Dehalococcoidia bacterium]|nr:hypothetical protein [Dehalococcoidia bacterium]HLB28695.1 hypothetical protein [Dehalococcoidia bacterium]